MELFTECFSNFYAFYFLIFASSDCITFRSLSFCCIFTISSCYRSSFSSSIILTAFLLSLSSYFFNSINLSLSSFVPTNNREFWEPSKTAPAKFLIYLSTSFLYLFKFFFSLITRFLHSAVFWWIEIYKLLLFSSSSAYECWIYLFYLRAFCSFNSSS